MDRCDGTVKTASGCHTAVHRRDRSVAVQALAVAARLIAPVLDRPPEEQAEVRHAADHREHDEDENRCGHTFVLPPPPGVRTAAGGSGLDCAGARA